MKQIGVTPDTVLLRRPGGLPEELLFAATSVPLLVVDAVTTLVVEANPAAMTVLRQSPGNLVGSPLSSAFAPSNTVALTHSLSRSLVLPRRGNSSHSLRLRPRNGGPDLQITYSLVRSGTDAYLIVRLATTDRERIDAPGDPVHPTTMELIEDLREGFVVTDHGLRVAYANRAFTDMVAALSPDDLRGKSLTRWLDLTASDMEQLREQLQQRRAATVILSTLSSGQYTRLPVEVCAIGVPDGADPCWGFQITDARANDLPGAAG